MPDSGGGGSLQRVPAPRFRVEGCRHAADARAHRARDGVSGQNEGEGKDMRIMRLLVMFDLPTKTKRDKDRYIRFKRFLEDDGYMREQNSIYTRSLLSRSSAAAHRDRLRDHIPPAGSVVAIELTEKQYVGREILVETRPQGRTRMDCTGQLFLEF
ncbi:CRISPR-associated endonuclease Cas2 [Collinsella sp. AM13-34]|nr:CRISPR-associated endonuclease Cas2 [Collinsella sp. AM13-34]